MLSITPGVTELLAEVNFGTVNWVVLAVYLVGVFVLGSLFARRQTSTDEYFRAGKRMGWFPILLSMAASIHSAISFIGQPGRIFLSDAGVLIASYVSGFIVFPVIAYLMLPFYRKLDVVTAYEYLERRFALSTRLLSSALFILQRLVWMALVVLAPSLALSVIVGIRVEYCILIIGLAATVYTVLGGMSAVIWTDVVQFIVLFVGEAMIFIVVATKLDGGFMEMIHVGFEDNKIWGSFDWDISRATFWTLMISGCVMGLSWGFDQLQVQRLMATRDEANARKSLMYTLVLNVPRIVVLILMGLALYAFYQAYPALLPEEVAQRADRVLPHFVVTQVPIGISGLIIAALFAASMSSFDSGLNCLIAAITVDWYKRVFKRDKTDAQYLLFAKVLSLCLGVAIALLAIGIYQAGIKSIIDTSNKYIGFLFGPIIGIFLLGIFTRRAKEIPAIMGGLAAFFTILVINIINGQYEDRNIIDPYFYGPLSVAITLVVGYFGSFLGTPLPYEKVKEYTLAKMTGWL
jgi:SSS family transporter